MRHLENALLSLINTWFRLLPRRRPTRRALQACKIISHRGEHDNRRVFENTLPAFRAAAEAGCWGLEFDLRWTRDLQPVVVHDADLRRVFGLDLKVADLTLAELQRHAPDVPPLQQVVREFGGRCHLMAELKADDQGDNTLRMARLRAAFAPLQAARDYHILALELDLFELAGFCGREAWLPVATLNTAALSRAVLEQKLAGICAQYLLMTPEIIRQHHRQGQKLGSGFAASRFGLYREINREVDWIFSNHAVQLETLRRQLLQET